MATNSPEYYRKWKERHPNYHRNWARGKTQELPPKLCDVCGEPLENRRRKRHQECKKKPVKR